MSDAQVGPAWIRPVPNLISAARVVLALAFPFVAPQLRLPLVIASGLSDGVDGYIARRFHCTSWEGGLLDAAADKLFTTVVLVTLYLEQTLLGWQLALLLTRDFFVAASAAGLALQRRWGDFKHMQSRLAGKATTFALFAFVGAVLLDYEGSAVFLMGLSITLSFAAAVDYGQSFGEWKQRVTSQKSER